MCSVYQGLPIEEVGMEGEGLVFVVYSDAIASMPGQGNRKKKFFLVARPLRGLGGKGLATKKK